MPSTPWKAVSWCFYPVILSRLCHVFLSGPLSLSVCPSPYAVYVLCVIGWKEISGLTGMLKKADPSIWALPLHSSIPSNQQQLVFHRPDEGKHRKAKSTYPLCAPSNHTSKYMFLIFVVVQPVI